MVDDVLCIPAANPGPFTLMGTNTWLIGRDPVWVIDPGPALDAHVAEVAAEVAARGGAGGIAITHDHPDHVGAVPELRDRIGGVPVAAVRYTGADLEIADGDRFGPLTVVATRGHAPDHVAFVAGRVCFTGDAVLGAGSVFVAPDPGAMAAYLAGLNRLRAMDLERICPGHGPVIDSPARKLDEYVAHRLERERRLVAALAQGRRSHSELLDAAWSDVPGALRAAAAITLAAHLAKLDDEGRLPSGVQRG